MTAFRLTAGLILLLAAASPAAAQTPGPPAESKPDAVIEAVPDGASASAPAAPAVPAAAEGDSAQPGTGPADAEAGTEKTEPASADKKADAKADAGAAGGPPEASGAGAATGDSASAGGGTRAADTPTAPDGDSMATASPGDRAPEQIDTKPAADNADAAQAPAASPQATGSTPSPSTAAPDVAQPAKGASTTPADTTPAPAKAAVRQEPEEPPTPPAPPPAPKLAVQTGGGAFAQAYQQVVLAPFSEETGVEIAEAPDDGSAGDLLLLDDAELARRCSRGDLVSLEVAELVPSSSGSTRDDFLDGALKPCGIAALAWSHVFAFDPARFAKRTPNTAADLFDARQFPGKRALPANGRGLIEAVLVADGVAPGDVYATLATSDGIGRVVKRLKGLGDNIVWYDDLPEAIALVRAGKAAIALTSNGHAFMEQARSGPLGLIWDGQVLHASYFAVPKDASDAAQAKKLVAFAARPEKLASLVRQIPYGPMRHSAVADATRLRHAVTGQELGDFLPTAPENLKRAVRFNAAWWDANADRMAGVLRTVRVGPPLPTRP